MKKTLHALRTKRRGMSCWCDIIHYSPFTAAHHQLARETARRAWQNQPLPIHHKPEWLRPVGRKSISSLIPDSRRESRPRDIRGRWARDMWVISQSERTHALNLARSLRATYWWRQGFRDAEKASNCNGIRYGDMEGRYWSVFELFWYWPY